MRNQDTSAVFDQKYVASHDKRVAKLAPMRDALHLFIRMVLSELPSDARVLCVGAGTGPELFALAEAFPGWRFTAVDRAAAMLSICRQTADERGIASRCTFHEGTLETLPDTGSFDAATSLLVSQFFKEPEARRGIFSQIAARLCPGGYLVNADLASDMSAPAFESLFEVWTRTMTFTGMPAEQVGKLRVSFGRGVAVLPPRDVERIIASSGFDAPVLFFQALLIHAWYARVAH